MKNEKDVVVLFLLTFKDITALKQPIDEGPEKGNNITALKQPVDEGPGKGNNVTALEQPIDEGPKKRSQYHSAGPSPSMRALIKLTT